MSGRSDSAQSNPAVAIERVLRAERDAAAAVEQVHREAKIQLDVARDEGLAIVNRAMDRIARWQRAHAAALEQRVEALRRQAGASTRDRGPPDEATIRAAVARVAARLTGADPGPNRPADGGNGGAH